MGLATIEDVADASRIGSSLRFDTALKIPRDSYGSWGINMDPDDPNVSDAAAMGYAEEWTETGSEHHAAVVEGARRSGLGDANARMNDVMAKLMLKHSSTRELSVLDLGCGPGGSTIALIESAGRSNFSVRSVTGDYAEVCMDAETAGRSNFSVRSVTLVDPSHTVKRAAEEVGRCIRGPLVYDQSLVEDWLRSSPGLDHNVVLFGASLHHMNVNLVLGELREKLSRGALIGVAEWCHSMLKSPAHFRVLVSVLDQLLEPGILERFDERFPQAKDRRALDDESPEEIAALMTMAGGFWPNHAVACAAAGVTPMFSPYEGHMPKDRWAAAFEAHGFETLAVKPLNPDNPVNTVFMFRKP